MFLSELALAQTIVKYYGSVESNDVFRKLFVIKSRIVNWIYMTITRHQFFSSVKQRSDPSGYGVLPKCMEIDDIVLKCTCKSRLNILSQLLAWTFYQSFIVLGALVEIIGQLGEKYETYFKPAKHQELSNLVYYDADLNLKLFEFELDPDSGSDTESYSPVMESTAQQNFKYMNGKQNQVIKQDHTSVDEELDISPTVDSDDGFPHIYPIVESDDGNMLIII